MMWRRWRLSRVHSGIVTCKGWSWDAPYQRRMQWQPNPWKLLPRKPYNWRKKRVFAARQRRHFCLLTSPERPGARASRPIKPCWSIMQCGRRVSLARIMKRPKAVDFFASKDYNTYKLALGNDVNEGRFVS